MSIPYIERMQETESAFVYLGEKKELLSLLVI